MSATCPERKMCWTDGFGLHHMGHKDKCLQVEGGLVELELRNRLRVLEKSRRRGIRKPSIVSKASCTF